MKKKLLAALMIAAMLLSGCDFIPVEDGESTLLGRLQAAFAENGIAALETTDAPEKSAQPTVKPTVQPMGSAQPEGSALPTATATPIARGSRDAEENGDIQKMQALLIALNFLSGEADGIFGGQTESALKAFQEMNGIEATGTLDERTRALLNSDAAIPMPTPEPTPLAKGAKGEDVTAIQNALRVYGFMTGTADGDFGGKTDQAVKAYQQYLHDLAEAEANKQVELLATPAPTVTPTPTPTPVPILALESPEADDASDMPIATDEEIEPTPEPTPVWEPDGVITDELKAGLTDGSFVLYREPLERGVKGAEVERLQRRLTLLWYYDFGIDGDFGGGTETSLKYFQKRNKLEETGIADEETQLILFSEAAVKSDKPRCMYQLKISIDKQRVYAYKWVDGSYTKLVKTMVCSTGLNETPTPRGTFRAGGACGKWYYFEKFDCWARYAYRINGGILFHSVLYSERDESTLRRGSVYALGSKASHGCVRLAVDDAKWIYNNCPSGTTVVIY